MLKFKKSKLITYSFILLLACIINKQIKAQCHIDDWTALKALYESTDGDNWKDRTGWDIMIDNQTSPPINCELKEMLGVGIDESGRVDSLAVFFNELNGTIPPEIGRLSNLISLNLRSNQLNSTIPSEIGNLSKLSFLELRGNQLSGVIPAQLVNLSKLKELDLSSNEFIGEILIELGNLKDLTNLNLRSNTLSGSIPAQLSNLSNLTYLNLGSNELSGSIPTQLGNLSNLTYLNLGNNELSGSIPKELINLSNLTYLNLSYNALTDGILPELAELSGLTGLDLANNSLGGSIPPELGNLTQLTSLQLDNNKLNGSIPSQLGGLTNLIWLGLANNNLSGNIPPELGTIESLNLLYLNNNNLTGVVPILPKTNPNLSPILHSIEHNYFSCEDLQTNFEYNNLQGAFKYSPQLYIPTNYESIQVNIFDTIASSRNLLLEVSYPWYETTGNYPMNEPTGNNPYDPTTGNYPMDEPNSFISYQWYQNDIPISGAVKPTLSIENVKAENAGVYTLHVRNINCQLDIGPEGFETVSKPIYVIVKGYDLLGQPVEYDQIMVEFDNAEETQLNKDKILSPNGGWVKKACNCNRELYLWQFPSTEAAAKALIEIDRKTKRTKKKSTLKGGFNNLLKIEDIQNSSFAYKVISETLSMDYPDSVRVYLLDSGLDDQSLDADASFTINNAPIDSCYIIERNLGYSFVDSTDSTIPVSTNYQDELWHGTYGFRSITESLTENNHLKVIPLKTFDKRGTGNLFDMTCALHHAIDNKADVINISAGYQGQPSAILEAAINEARKKGVFITAAVGNDSVNMDTLAQYPAFYAGQYYTYETFDDLGNIQLDSTRYDNVISIASINENDKISSFSNVGKQSVTIAAYGENIHGYGLGNDEIVALGTSMSTYFVTKELALEIALNKNRSYQQIWNDFEQNRLVANNSLEEFTQTGKQLKVKLEVASISGCANPNACNYFEYATIDDGTCMFASYHPSDLAALKALYVSTNGDNWKRNNGWEILMQDTIPFPCNLNNLYGIRLNDEGRVYKINLYNNNLNGLIPAEIEGLTELTELYLAANNLFGEIPVQLTKLDKITNLILSGNNLRGSIPLEIDGLVKLERLNLSYNQFGGTIPVQTGQLNQLKYLQLDHNQLTGNLPKEIAQLKKLYLLNISNNLLSGCYQNNLESLCNQNWSPLFNSNANISDGNYFDATWENFCTNTDGACNNNKINAKLKLFNLYPNPSTGKLNIKFLTTESKSNTLKVLNLEGKCLLKVEGKQIVDTTFELDLSDLPKGMYILKLLNESKNYNKKFILN